MHISNRTYFIALNLLSSTITTCNIIYLCHRSDHCKRGTTTKRQRRV